MRALIIDGSKSLSVLVEQHCAKLHLACEVQNGGNLALKSARQKPFDIVCFPAQLTDMDGIAFAERLINTTKDKPPLLLMVADDDDRQLLSRATSTGVTDVFLRNQLDELLSYISQWLLDSRLAMGAGSILYVEEDEEYAARTCTRLAELGYTTTHVPTVVDALLKLKKNPYDLIITDYQPTDSLSGKALIRHVRGMHSHLLELPVLVLADMSNRQTKLEIMHSGASDFVDKAGYAEELIVRAANLVKTHHLYEQVEYQRVKLQDLAMTDQLTGIHNRHYLFEVAPQKLSESRRHDFAVALLIIDLDKFKAINDNHGHPVGDLVLKAVGQLLKNQCRNEDVVSRFGGEEFVIVMSHCALGQAVTKAERIRQAIMALNPEGLPVTASFGIAIYTPSRETTFNELFTRADDAVYRAKDAGRNRVEVDHFETPNSPVQAP